MIFGTNCYQCNFTIFICNLALLALLLFFLSSVCFMLLQYCKVYSHANKASCCCCCYHGEDKTCLDGLYLVLIDVTTFRKRNPPLPVDTSKHLSSTVLETEGSMRSPPRRISLNKFYCMHRLFFFPSLYFVSRVYVCVQKKIRKHALSRARCH